MLMAVRRICVLILNWNRSSCTLRCVNAVRAQTVNASIVVIDNGSQPEEVRALRDGLPASCRLVKLSRNYGFAAGMNVGMAAALREGFEQVWLLNNDAFPEPDCLRRLTAALEADLGLALVTPALYGLDGKEQHAGGNVNWSNGNRSTLRAEQLSHSLCFGEWLTGTAPLLRADALRQVGGFDERYFAYWEDIDLSIRLFQSGWRLRAVPEAKCVHLVHESSGGGEAPFAWYMMTRNAWLFLRKHLPLGRRRQALVGLFVFHLDYAIHCHRSQMPQRCLAILRGLWAILRGETHKPMRVLAPRWVRRLLTWRWQAVARVLKWLRPELIHSK